MKSDLNKKIAVKRILNKRECFRSYDAVNETKIQVYGEDRFISWALTYLRSKGKDESLSTKTYNV